ncbi:MAG: class I SAM-dependent DNA methyltransferase [Candidatus Thorarchaeota archaeon]
MFQKRIEKIYDLYSSEFYDFHADRDDINFYLSYAKKSTGKILDLGCGTGRILIPIAKLGKEIVGIDNSDYMLEICKKKIKKEFSSKASNITLKKADITNFELDEKYSLIIIPFGPFNYLESTTEQINCLTCINKHLGSEKILVFDVWYPNNLELIKSEHGYDVVKNQPYFKMPDGRKVQWGIKNVSVDYNRQLIFEEMYYNINYPDGKKEKLIYPASMRYFHRYEIEHLLALSGFKINKLYSDFNKNEFGEKYPSELIVEAIKCI